MHKVWAELVLVEYVYNYGVIGRNFVGLFML